VAPGSSWKHFVWRFAIALAAVLGTTGLVVNTGNRWFEREFDKIPTTNIRKDVLATPEEKGEPANFLIIGTDSRAFVENEQQAEAFGTAADVAGQRSDTMMIVHVEPAAKRGFVVSLPRDTWVEVPGHGENRLNTALELGGPSLLIETITTNFAVPITHFLEIDIEGFQSIVNTIGGVQIYFPTPARDSLSGLDQPEAGCRELDGGQALTYVRARHYEWYDAAAKRWRTDPRSDLSRIERQQYFMRSLAQAALDRGASNPATALALVSDMSESVHRDEGLELSDIKGLINSFRDLEPSAIEMLTLPVEGGLRGEAQVLVPKQPDADAVLDRLRTFTWLADLPTPRPPSEIRVGVVNASGRPGLGDQVRSALMAHGFVAEESAREEQQVTARTEIQFGADNAGEALTALSMMGTSNAVLAQPSALDGFDVVLRVGQDWDALDARVKQPVDPGTTAAAPTTAPPPTTVPRSPSATAVVPIDPATGGTLVGCP
jgi:polyisoprenyl-teichoic acid--peptidoglycan teichoic acid transferase